MPRPPGQRKTHPTRAATRSRHRVEPWFTDAEWDVLRDALDREPDAAGVRSLALAQASALKAAPVASWPIDRLDGAGPSGLVLDWTPVTTQKERQ